MSTAFEETQKILRDRPQRWLVTGCAGFIGSNLVEALLDLDQEVVGLDDYSLGHPENLNEIRSHASGTRWARFTMIEGSVSSPEACARACEGVDRILHQAAIGSVPRSIDDPLASHEANLTGFLTLLEASRRAGVARFVYASSSAVYGDSPGLPKRESTIGHPLSPYAVTKRANELYAEAMAEVHGVESIGLRYFNVFGPRQDPRGAYAAVIPCWIAAMLAGEPVYINGTGETSRDFCYVTNTVQANLLAAMTQRPDAVNRVYNVAVNRCISLNTLFELLREHVAAARPQITSPEPVRRDFRAGDVMHSQADVSLARELLGYEPTHTLEQGLSEALPWYIAHLE
jgi:UDP-N-acetylglucosamine 4-epimerase